nr:sodium/glutamate symporter [Aminobacter carboxidus]
MTLISEYSLSVFLAISLMSMQLWTLSGMAGPLLVVVVIAYVWIVLFPLLGRDYQSAVLSAGFVGLSLGATPTAVANMTAVTRHYGPSPTFFGH